jgi:L-2,4-diaminobutyric acid acetyltransferase
MVIEELKKSQIKELCTFIKSVGNLDLNSSYLYLLLAHYFSQQCLVAKVDQKIIGFITAIKTDNDANNNTIFIWQVGVDQDFQCRGIAKKLLQTLIERQSNNITKIEFTISPSNKPSLALFQKYADKIGATVDPVAKFDSELFFEEGHEEEIFYQIKIGK